MKRFDRTFEIFMAMFLGWTFYETWRDDGWMGLFYMILFMVITGVALFVVIFGIIEWMVRRHGTGNS